jgi:hypothetical protein
MKRKLKVKPILKIVYECLLKIDECLLSGIFFFLSLTDSQSTRLQKQANTDLINVSALGCREVGTKTGKKEQETGTVNYISQVPQENERNNGRGGQRG